MEKESQWDFSQSWDPSALLHIPGDPGLQPHPKNFRTGPKIFLSWKKMLQIPPKSSTASLLLLLEPFLLGWQHPEEPGRPKNSKSKVKNSEFSLWEWLSGSSALPGWEPEAGEGRGAWKDTPRRSLGREKGISGSFRERERIPSSWRGAPSDPQHKGGVRARLG